MLGLTDNVLDVCLKQEDVTCDDVYDRTIILYFLLGAHLQDYVLLLALEKDDNLYKSLIGRLAKLAGLFTYPAVTEDKSAKLLDQGKIPLSNNCIMSAEMAKRLFLNRDWTLYSV
ncbi:hypothetical protein ACFLV0_04775 [Chloroflexota bacterium]